MSNTKLTPLKSEAVVVSLGTRQRKRLTTGAFVPWKTVSPRQGEAVRWECVDGRWVTIALGHDEHAGEAIVRNSWGGERYLDTFEGALELAKQWRMETDLPR